MKRLWLLACVLALVGAPSWGSGLGAGVGYWDTSDAEDDTGFSTKLIFDVGDKWNIDFRASFFNGYSLRSGPRVIAIEAVPLDLGISYDFQSSSRLTPYVGGGFSYVFYQSDVQNIVVGQPETSRIKDQPGWYGVVGIEVPFAKRMAFYLEGMYRLNEPTVQGDGVAAFDEIPVDFSGVAATLGLAFTW